MTVTEMRDCLDSHIAAGHGDTMVVVECGYGSNQASMVVECSDVEVVIPDDGSRDELQSHDEWKKSVSEGDKREGCDAVVIRVEGYY